jgi:hypothetical protein
MRAISISQSRLKRLSLIIKRRHSPMHLLGVPHHRVSLPQLINRLNATATFKPAIRVKRGKLHFKEGTQRGWKPEVLRRYLETLIPMLSVLALLLATLASKT